MIRSAVLKETSRLSKNICKAADLKEIIEKDGTRHVEGAPVRPRSVTKRPAAADGRQDGRSGCLAALASAATLPIECRNRRFVPFHDATEIHTATHATGTQWKTPDNRRQLKKRPKFTVRRRVQDNGILL